MRSPIEPPGPLRAPQPPRATSPSSGSGGGSGTASSVAPSIGSAGAPQTGEIAGPSPGRPAARRPARDRPRARTARREARRREASAPAERDASVSDRIGDVIGALPWQLAASIGALAFLALLMAGRSALGSARTGRLTRQRAELRSDVGALQSALLPPVPDAIGDVLLSVAYRPAEGPAAGGDFHDVVPLEDGRFGLILGDVSGHGREALAQTALVHYTVRAYLAAGLQPRLALRLTDESLEGTLGDDFVTVLAAVYDPADSTLRYATAGHPVPIVVGDEADDPVDALTSPPIGIGPRTGDRETCVSIPSGSRLCLFTDGLTEAREEEGELLEREGLTRLLAEGGESLDAAALLARLTDRTNAGSDDMTACLVNPLDAAGTGSVTEELEIDPAFDTPANSRGSCASAGSSPARSRTRSRRPG